MNSKKTKLLRGDLLDEDVEMTLAQLCQAGEVSGAQLIELVEQGVIDPLGPEPAEWRFVSVSLRRVRITGNLQRDLGVNAPGAALALELLEEIEELRARLRRLET